MENPFTEALANYGKEKQNILRKLEVPDPKMRKKNHQPPLQTLEKGFDFVKLWNHLFGDKTP